MKIILKILLLLIPLLILNDKSDALSDNQIRQICLKKKRKFNCIRNLELKKLDLLEGKRIEIPVIEFKK